MNIKYPIFYRTLFLKYFQCLLSLNNKESLESRKAPKVIYDESSYHDAKTKW